MSNRTKKSVKYTKSFSPSINKLLHVKSIKTYKKKKLNICKNLLKIKINVNNKERCLNYDNKNVINFLLNGLKYTYKLYLNKL